jgi:hypothetical protein
VIGQVLLVVAAARLLLIGITPQSRTVHEAETRPFANIITFSLVAGSLFVAAAAAGWLAVESGGTGPLPPAPSVSPGASFEPAPSSEPSVAPSVEPTPSVTASPEVSPEVSPSVSPSGSGEISPAP